MGGRCFCCQQLPCTSCLHTQSCWQRAFPGNWHKTWLPQSSSLFQQALQRVIIALCGWKCPSAEFGGFVTAEQFTWSSGSAALQGRSIPLFLQRDHSWRKQGLAALFRCSLSLVAAVLKRLKGSWTHNPLREFLRWNLLSAAFEFMMSREVLPKHPILCWEPSPAQHGQGGCTSSALGWLGEPRAACLPQLLAGSRWQRILHGHGSQAWRRACTSLTRDQPLFILHGWLHWGNSTKESFKPDSSPNHFSQTAVGKWAQLGE